MDDALYRYYYTIIHEHILAAARPFIDLISIHQFDSGNGKLCRMILSHVFIDGCCGSFPVLLTSFNKRGRQHYIQALNRYHENLSMLYTIIKSLLQG